MEPFYGLAFQVFFLGLLMVGLIVASVRGFAAIQNRLQKLWLIETKLDLLLKHADVEFDPYALLSLPRDVVDALLRGEKLMAIKLYREATKSDLTEAKKIIDEVQRRTGI
jgi:hypothetical protein